MYQVLAKRVNGQIQVFRRELMLENLESIAREPGYTPALGELKVTDAMAGDELTLAAFHSGYTLESLPTDRNRQCFLDWEGRRSLLKTVDARSGQFLIAII